MQKYKINIETETENLPDHSKAIKEIAELVFSKEDVLKAEVNVILVDDAFIIEMNKQYLGKDSTTDVISFNFDDPADLGNLEGEVYANIQQIERQAEEYGVSFSNELFRIVVHGLLHLIGYDDASYDDKKNMTEKEDYYLSLIH